jgi:hypothetical protein
LDWAYHVQPYGKGEIKNIQNSGRTPRNRGITYGKWYHPLVFELSSFSSIEILTSYAITIKFTTTWLHYLLRNLIKTSSIKSDQIEIDLRYALKIEKINIET